MLKEHGLMSRLMPVMVTRVFYLLEMASSTQIGLSYRPKSLKDRIETLNSTADSGTLRALFSTSMKLGTVTLQGIGIKLRLGGI